MKLIVQKYGGTSVASADVIKKDLFVKNKPFTKYEISEYWLDIWKVKGIHNQHYKAENA